MPARIDSSIALQLRLSMKSYSFVRENAYKVLYPWNKDDEEGPAVWYAGQMQPRVASFSQYFYFIFAPTMLYRDHYPRCVLNPTTCSMCTCSEKRVVLIYFILTN